ncbi:MAG: hypothetical protein ACOYPR_18265, partial [Saprospiraceae bacterium]
PCHGGGRGFESRPVRKKLKVKILENRILTFFVFGDGFPIWAWFPLFLQADTRLNKNPHVRHENRIWEGVKSA